MNIKLGEAEGRFFKDVGNGPEEIDVREYSQLQTAREAGPVEAGLVAAGKMLSNIPGINRITNIPEDQGQMAAMEAAHPYATTAGEMGAGMIGPVRGGLAANALYGMAQGAATSEDRLLGGALGGAGAAMGDMAGRVVGKIRNAFRTSTRPATKVQEELLEAGYDLTPAQTSGDQGLMKLERSLEKTPQGQKIVGAKGRANQDLIQARANEAIGLDPVPAPLDRNARDLAAEQIGDRMRAAVADTDLQISEDLGKRISRIIKNDDMLELPEIPAGGWLSGDDYMRVRSGLTDAQRSAQGPARNYIKKTIDQIDEEFLAVSSPEQAAAYRQAREHYKNLIQLEKGKALTPDGEVNWKTAGNAFRSKTGYGARGVENALPETQALIRDLDNLSGKQVNPYIGDSGTAEGGLRNMLNPWNWAEGVGAEQYYKRGGNIGGLLSPAPEGYQAIGAGIGRSGAGLLTE